MHLYSKIMTANRSNLPTPTTSAAASTASTSSSSVSFAEVKSSAAQTHAIAVRDVASNVNFLDLDLKPYVTDDSEYLPNILGLANGNILLSDWKLTESTRTLSMVWLAQDPDYPPQYKMIQTVQYPDHPNRSVYHYMWELPTQHVLVVIDSYVDLYDVNGKRIKRFHTADDRFFLILHPYNHNEFYVYLSLLGDIGGNKKIQRYFCKKEKLASLIEFFLSKRDLAHSREMFADAELARENSFKYSKLILQSHCAIGVTTGAGRFGVVYRVENDLKHAVFMLQSVKLEEWDEKTVVVFHLTKKKTVQVKLIDSDKLLEKAKTNPNKFLSVTKECVIHKIEKSIPLELFEALQQQKNTFKFQRHHQNCITILLGRGIVYSLDVISGKHYFEQYPDNSERSYLLPKGNIAFVTRDFHLKLFNSYLQVESIHRNVMGKLDSLVRQSGDDKFDANLYHTITEYADGDFKTDITRPLMGGFFSPFMKANDSLDTVIKKVEARTSPTRKRKVDALSFSSNGTAAPSSSNAAINSAASISSAPVATSSTASSHFISSTHAAISSIAPSHLISSTHAATHSVASSGSSFYAHVTTSLAASGGASFFSDAAVNRPPASSSSNAAGHSPVDADNRPFKKPCLRNTPLKIE